MAFKMKGSPFKRNFEPSPFKNYRNPQEYEVFNWGNKPSPMRQTLGQDGFKIPGKDFPHWKDLTEKLRQEKISMDLYKSKTKTPEDIYYEMMGRFGTDDTEEIWNQKLVISQQRKENEAKLEQYYKQLNEAAEKEKKDAIKEDYVKKKKSRAPLKQSKDPGDDWPSEKQHRDRLIDIFGTDDLKEIENQRNIYEDKADKYRKSTEELYNIIEGLKEFPEGYKNLKKYLKDE